jgi:putative ABC transport system ATP-binding protein
MPLLRFDAVEKRYRLGSRDVTALDGLNLEIQLGDFLAVVGPSGSGKSTFLQIAGCLDVPTKGGVIFDGTEVSALTDDERSRIRLVDVGFVFQHFSLLPRVSALDNVALPLIYAGVRRRARRARAAAMLERVGLADRMEHTPAQLSGGQQQRIAIARALVNEPRLLLADEPTGALDSRTGAELMTLFRDLNQTGTTVVVVSHDRAVTALANRELTFRDGRLVREESPNAADETEVMS